MTWWGSAQLQHSEPKNKKTKNKLILRKQLITIQLKYHIAGPQSKLVSSLFGC